MTKRKAYHVCLESDLYTIADSHPFNLGKGSGQCNCNLVASAGSMPMET